MAHTPGPITIMQSRSSDDYALISGGIVGEAYRRIDDNSYADAEANARLWAAAPELLEACEAIFDAIARGELKYTHKRQSDSDPYHPANTKLCAAIAKATGAA